MSDQLGLLAAYRGVDRAYTARNGSLPPADVADFVERKFRQGWRSLTVTLEGREVGAIYRQLGRREWWVEP